MTRSSSKSSDQEIIAPLGSGFDDGAMGDALDSIGQWAQRYLDSLGTRDVAGTVEPGEILAMLDKTPPTKGFGGDGWNDLTADIEQIIEPGLVHWQSPRFFAYFPCQGSLPGVMGELVAAVLNVNGMLRARSEAGASKAPPAKGCSARSSRPVGERSIAGQTDRQ
jgi:Pyridoxal-dependent decarboxylase conserved domain